MVAVERRSFPSDLNPKRTLSFLFFFFLIFLNGAGCLDAKASEHLEGFAFLLSWGLLCN